MDMSLTISEKAGSCRLLAGWTASRLDEDMERPATVQLRGRYHSRVVLYSVSARTTNQLR